MSLMWRVCYVCLSGLQPTLSWGSGSCSMTQMTPAPEPEVTSKSACLWWGRGTSLRYDSHTTGHCQTLPQCFVLFLLLHVQIWRLRHRRPTASHCSLVLPVYCRRRRGRQTMTRTTLRVICCCLLEWLFAGPHCRWRCTEPRTFPRVRRLTSEAKHLKISGSSLEIRGSVPASIQS